MSAEHQTIIDATAMAALAADPADENGRQKVVLSTALHYADSLRSSHPYMPVEEVHGNAAALAAAVLNRISEIEATGGSKIGNA